MRQSSMVWWYHSKQGRLLSDRRCALTSTIIVANPPRIACTVGSMMCTDTSLLASPVDASFVRGVGVGLGEGWGVGGLGWAAMHSSVLDSRCK